MIHYDTHKGLSDLPDAVAQATADLAPHAHEFDSIAVCGVSGLMVGSPVALALGKPLVVVRKDTDMLMPCVHVSEVENARNSGGRVLFLDDYIGGGHTVRHVADSVTRGTPGAVVSSYEYKHRRYTPPRRASRAA